MTRPDSTSLTGGTDQLARAIIYLSNVCDGATSWDGAGFSKVDSSFGHSLAGRAGSWSPKQRHAAWKLAHRYKGQLERAGIDISQVAEPEISAPPEEEFELSWTGTAFALQTPYSPTLVADIKALRGRRWNPDDRVWLIEPSVENAAFLQGLKGCQIAEAADAKLNELINTQQKHIESSRALHSDLEVAGLKGDLMPFQRAGVEYAIDRRRTFLADEMGLGKTAQALATIHALSAYPALVVCPASLKLNWQREVHKWLPDHVTVCVVNGRGPLPLADITVINYDLLRKYQADLGITEERTSKGKLRFRQIQQHFGAVVLDESHYAKEAGTQRTEACKALAKDVPTVLLLTGTAVLNRPKELISQLQILGRLDEFGGWHRFVARYCDGRQEQVSRYTWAWQIDGHSNEQELNAELRARCFVRRTKKEVLPELPAVRRSVVPVEITNWKEYSYAEDELIGWLREKAAEDREFLDSIAHLNAEERADAIRQRQDSAEIRARKAEHLVRINALKKLTAQGKLESIIAWVQDFLDGSDEKLILFADHREIQRGLHEAFPDAAVIDADSSRTKVEEDKDRFQSDPNCRLIICSLTMAQFGHTLSEGQHVVFAEFAWTPTAHDQAEGRAYGRLNNPHGISAWYLVGLNTIDIDIVNLIEKKRSVTTAIHDGREVENQDSILAALSEALLESRRLTILNQP